MNRNILVKFGAIVIILSLFLSIFVGTVASFATQSTNSASIAVGNAYQGPVPDIDGDGIVNGLDEDIDGDGKPNFDDGDPAETNGGGDLAPAPSTTTILQPLSDGGTWLLIPTLAAAFVGGLFALRKKRK